MLTTLQIVTICLTAVALSTSLAHALELPGKMRLGKDAYTATQSIYYPGFTIAGLGEGFAIVGSLILVAMTPKDRAVFWWTLLALVALLSMHAVYWAMTHPVNKFWLKDQKLEGLGKSFFSAGSPAHVDPNENSDTLWQRYRDRWENSHVIRAILAAIAFLSLLIALAI